MKRNGNGSFQFEDFSFVELGHFVHQHLEDGGSKEMAVNGAAGIQFAYTVPADFNFLLTSFHGMVFAAAAVEANEFGVATALTNGCQVYIKNPGDSVIYDFLDGEEIKTNADWGMFGADISSFNGVAGSLGYAFKWDVVKQASKPIRLREGHKFIVKIQDDLSSAATSFQTVVSGVLIPKSKEDR